MFGFTWAFDISQGYVTETTVPLTPEGGGLHRQRRVGYLMRWRAFWSDSRFNKVMVDLPMYGTNSWLRELA